MIHVGDSTGVSKNTSALVKMVTGAKLRPDVEGKIGPQLIKEVTGEVVDSKKNTTEYGPQEVMIGGNFDAQYQSAIRSLAKQQVLLGRVLNNKYTKKFGSNRKKESKAVNSSGLIHQVFQIQPV